MTLDSTNIQFSSANSSLKVLKEGSGSFAVGALGGAGETLGSVLIPHGYTSDNLLFQVTTNGGYLSGVILPWESNDGRMIQYAQLDSTNLAIACISSDSSGLGAPAFTVSYFYRLLIP